MIGRSVMLVLAAGISSGAWALEPPRRPVFDAEPAPAAKEPPAKDAANLKSARVPKAAAAAKPASASSAAASSEDQEATDGTSTAPAAPSSAQGGATLKAVPVASPTLRSKPVAAESSAVVIAPVGVSAGVGQSGIDALIARHAQANGIPANLVHQVVRRESGYNPRAVGRGGALGLMQIKHATARALGYAGPASGLLDADTNLGVGVRYLAGAYRTANGDPGRAIGFFRRGYYYDAKRKGTWASVMAPAGTIGAKAEAVATGPVETSSTTPADTGAPDYRERTNEH